MDGVVSVMPNHILKLHTTRSWDFMGFKGKLGSSKEGDVIVALLDTGKFNLINRNHIYIWSISQLSLDYLFKTEASSLSNLSCFLSMNGRSLARIR